MVVWIGLELSFLILSVSIYYWPETDIRVKSYALWICLALPCLISSVLIYYGLESDIRLKIYDYLKFLRPSVIQFQPSRYIMGLNHTSESKVIAIWICLEFLSLISSVLIYYGSQSDIRVESYGRLNLPWASKFNFECLNILCNRIRHPSEKLWSFEFIENFHFSISSFSIFRSPQSYTRVKNYDHLNLPCASMFNFKHLDILCNRIRHPSEKLWPF